LRQSSAHRLIKRTRDVRTERLNERASSAARLSGRESAKVALAFPEERQAVRFCGPD